MRKGSGTFFVYRRFCGESTQSGKRTKAGYHRGGGILPFALRLPILRVSGQSLRTSVHGRYARTQEKWQVLTYRGILSDGGMLYSAQIDLKVGDSFEKELSNGPEHRIPEHRM